MKLSELQTGEKAVIVRVHGHGSFRKRLIEMGFIQGKEVTVVLNAPLKDPIEYEIIGYKISLRREEAERIDVVNEAEAREALVSDEHLQGLPEDLAERERLDRALAHLAEQSQLRQDLPFQYRVGRARARGQLFRRDGRCERGAFPPQGV